MIYLICGENTFLGKAKVLELLKEREMFFEKSFPVLKLDGENLTWRDFDQEIKKQGLFGKTFFVIIEKVWGNKKFKEEFLKRRNFFKSPETLVVFFEPREIDSGDPLFEYIKKEGRIYQFSAPKTGEIKKFIIQTIKEKGFLIQARAVQLFLEFGYQDFWEIYNQLQKLMAYKYHQKIIEEKDVLLLIKPKAEAFIFRTIEAFAKKQKKEALSFIYQHLLAGDSPLYLLAMVKYQFRNLLIIKEQTPFKNLQKSGNFHPYLFKKLIIQSKNFSLDQLRNFYQKIFKIDLLLKKGKISPEAGLELLVLDL